eukprot:2779605-Alexandrium_andersonii.AAC.1
MTTAALLGFIVPLQSAGGARVAVDDGRSLVQAEDGLICRPSHQRVGEGPGGLAESCSRRPRLRIDKAALATLGE